ncbi:CaiB/BaiF CoA transferase family protein [Bacillus marasmi]|uniref:CaiB/BaiF CoA transferase family protein n=1 Tax=Bacillus marasmi TaxID=1926279 RepID=UPI0011C9ABE1|nr:CoA transferase [Bacillus marasmi]
MLSNIRILDFSNYIPGPFATLRLAELGAEVIKIESLTGDLARITEVIGDKEGPVFRAMNRNKKSLAVNLKTAEGKEIVQQMIKKSDVIVESFRPGVMDKLGLGYEAVKELKQEIVYCSITGYGQEGDLSKLGSHDLNFLSLSGVLSQMKNSHGEPIHPTITFADYIGAFAASERILTGIISKQQTGKGSYHSISVTDVMTSIMVNHAVVAEETGFGQGLSVLNGTMISYAIYPTKDRRFVGFGALEFKFWENFCHAVNRPEWISAHGTEANESNPVYLEVKDLFLQKTLEEWAAFGRGVDCCLTPILEINELKGYGNQNVYTAAWGDEQVKMHGDLKQKNQTPPPKLGEHSIDIVSKLLDKSEEQVKEWEKKGILKSEISKLLK